MFRAVDGLPVALSRSGLRVGRLLTILLIFAAALEVHGAELTGNVNFEISPQPLGAALLRYSEQAGVQIAFSDVIAKDRQSAGLRGTYSRSRALKMLLDGSGLSYRVTADRTVAIGPADTVQAPADTSDASVRSGDQHTVLTAGTEPSMAERPQTNEMSALESITVMSQRTTDAVARAAEFEASNLINVTTSEEISRLPDVNAAEAIRRVPGISLEGDTGEGRFINIRGLDADLNSTTFGGLRLPPTNNASPFAGGRAVAYDSIPIGFIGALTVTKIEKLPEKPVSVSLSGLRGMAKGAFGKQSAADYVEKLRNGDW